jgi:predicted N-acetyltransferase YhbS
MRIVNLADRPARDIDLVGGWIFGLSREEQTAERWTAWLEEFRTSLTRREIPATFVAVDEDRVLGTASLVASDLPALPQYSPWLAAVHIPEESRGRGVCAALVRRVQAEAALLGFPVLYFGTVAREEGYERLGWHCVDWAIAEERPVKVMARDLEQTEQAA